MPLHKKAISWLVDYGHFIRGAATMTVHREPPQHYLGHIVKGKAPVILVPGILGRWGMMKRLGDRISLKGHPVYIVPELGLNIYNIPTSAKTLRALVVHLVPRRGYTLPHISRGGRAVRKLIEKEKLSGVVLVAHSKGGLIGKYLLAHHNADHRVLGMVAIATPFSGSAMAKLIPHDSFKELLADSKIVRDLEKHDEVNKQIVSVIPEYDHYVWAKKGSYLAGAKNIPVAVSGHHTVLFDKGVSQVVLRSIGQICKQPILQSAQRVLQ